MDFEVTSVDVVYSWQVRFLMAFLLFFPLLFVSRRVPEWRRPPGPRPSVLAEIYLPYFVAITASWISCYHLARAIQWSGAGIASRAAGAAESQIPLILATAEILVFALLTLPVHLRSREIGTADV